MGSTTEQTSLYVVLQKLRGFGLRRTIFLQPARFSTNPIQLEGILLLKYKRKYWSKFTVAQAIKIEKEEDSNERYKKEVGRFGVLDKDYD
jgi:hypothetical protein